MSVSDPEANADGGSRDQAVCEAAGQGDLDSVRRLHQSGARLQACDNEPLCRACGNGHLDVVRYLHENGVALNTHDNEPMLRACSGGHLRIVRHLSQNGASLIAPDNEPLCRACGNGHLDVVRYLHENGVALNTHDNEPMLRACSGGHLRIVRHLSQNGASLIAPDNEPLCRAAAAGHLELVRCIHQHGGDISVHDNEPLRLSAAGRHSAVVQYLHDAGASTNLLTIETRHTIEQMKQELLASPAVYHPSAFWKTIGDVNERVLGWSGEANFKRTLNQNYFNFIPTSHDDARMTRARRLTHGFDHDMSAQYDIHDPDRDPASWISWYPGYFIFREPDRAVKRELYREFIALIFEYALRRDRSGLLTTLEEPTLGNPIRVHRNGRLISQDMINSLRERNSIVAGIGAGSDTRFVLAELGAGYGRLGHVLLQTTQCRYFVFDIPPALHLSQWYLTTLFPARRAFQFRHFETFEEIESELSRADIAFFTPNQLAEFPSGYFDVFATISSIHEMRRDQIDHFMTLMGRTTKSTLYLKQQHDYVNPIDNLTIGKDDYPVPAGWSPRREHVDPINPGFFERLYRRG